MNNILESWKKECYLLSSDLALEKQLKRKDVDAIFKILLDYFGWKYFEISKSTPNTKANWIHYLLVNYSKPACIAAIYEIANLLIYLKTLSKSTQKKYKTLFNDPRQLRDMFFELYIYRLLDYNKIRNEKKVMEGMQELDLLCTIKEKIFLGECRKMYAPGIEILDTLQYLTTKLTSLLKTLNKGFGFIGVINFSNPSNPKLKEIFEKKINDFILGFNNQPLIQSINYHNTDENGELIVVDYSIVKEVEIEKSLKYHILFKVIPPFSITPGILNYYRVQVEALHQIPHDKVNNKLFRILNEKKEQHLNSKYLDKIYFIDSETIPDFEFSIFQVDEAV